MKVILCGPYPYKNEEIWGGIEAVLENLNSGFRIYESDLLLEILSGNKKVKQIYENYDNVTYIKQPRVKLGTVFISSYPFRLNNILNKIEFDVINAHSIDFGYYGLKMNNKLLLTLHAITWETTKDLPTYKKPAYNIFYVKRLYKILKNLKYFVSINPYSRKMVEKKTNATIFDIYNPIPDEFFKIKNLRDEKRMLYLGIISNRKNLLTLIKSLTLIKKEIKDFKLVIAGKIGNKNYFEEIVDYIAKNNLKDNIEYLGRITKEKKFEEFSKMNFLILPSLYETAPMVISESFAAEKPVIASNICGIPYMIDDDKNGLLINPNDEQDISRKILYLLENPQEAKSMGINGRKYAEKYHSLKTVVKKYKSAYEEIVAKSS
jgi:glycosyltransferase involved in cell wall biosynthesis